jgi:hypothetical protein
MDLLPVETIVREGNIRAMYGTFVKVTIESNVELKEAMLEVNGLAALMRVNGRFATGRLRVEQDGKYEIMMTSGDGFRNFPVSFPVIAQQDELPDVRIVNLPREELLIEIGDHDTLPLQIEAQDREGIRQLDVVYELSQLTDETIRPLQMKGITGTIFFDPSRQQVDN